MSRGGNATAEPAAHGAAFQPWVLLAGRAFTSTNVGELRACVEEVAELTEPEPRGACRDARRWQAALDVPADAVEKEHVRLFLDPLGAPCLPWQSAWTENPPRLKGEAHHSALAWYRAEGLEPRQENEPADHAGFLLLFWARLLAGGDAAKVALFRRQHLEWLGPFCLRVREETRLDFFRLAADLTLDLLEEEVD